jgi:hypothetical protein
LTVQMDWDKVKVVAERYREQILSLPGVVGISTGVRRESGEVQPCIRVYLSKPVERGELEDQRIPWELEGTPVDAVVTGEIVALDDRS